jgi:ubiquinone/menaquinone biosynthesis C-methylase UbiE
MESAYEVIGCNLEEGIPLPDDSFDIVVALDVVEHLEQAHFIVQDMMRVARKGIIVSLPNMYYWSFRWNFLRGRGVSGKYTFPPTPPVDRHRWILSYEESVEFMRGVTGKVEIETYKVMPKRGRLKYLMPLELCLANHAPNLLSYGSLFYVKI